MEEEVIIIGTRGALGVKCDGKYFVTYNHFDSYPDGLGSEVVEFAKKLNTDAKIEKFKNRFKNVKLVNENISPTEEEVEKYKEFADLNVSNKSLTDWYCLLRKVQGIDTLKFITDGTLEVMIDSFSFLKDSLFCEYAYIINLDEKKIEFYEGFNRKPQEGNPLPIEQKTYEDSEYYPVKFKGYCFLEKIPKDWKERFYSEKEEE